MIEICTTGGYGHTALGFFDPLTAAGVDVLVDVRQRRGMRGRQYSFLNSRALQEELQNRGIAYLHLKMLAPPPTLRALQKANDHLGGVSKRERTDLSPHFVSAYESGVLASVDAKEILSHIAQFQRPCFFCVEQNPNACHRSLVADWLARLTGTATRHL